MKMGLREGKEDKGLTIDRNSSRIRTLSHSVSILLRCLKNFVIAVSNFRVNFTGTLQVTQRIIPRRVLRVSKSILPTECIE